MATADMADVPQNVKMPPVIGDDDIIFACPHCAGELVVDREGAGLEVPCPHCGEALVIPDYQPSIPSLPVVVSAGASGSTGDAKSTVERHFDFTSLTPEQIQHRASELQHQLKENRSQDTEMRGHVNRATMELHRLQLRLKKLQERQSDIEAELAAIKNLSVTGK